MSEFSQELSVTAQQEFAQARDDGQIVTQGNDFVGNGASLADATDDAFHIAQALQADGEAAAQGRTFVELFHALKTLFQLAQVEERLRQRAA